jgi:hypothetical protein
MVMKQNLKSSRHAAVAKVAPLRDGAGTRRPKAFGPSIPVNRNEKCRQDPKKPKKNVIFCLREFDERI